MPNEKAPYYDAQCLDPVSIETHIGEAHHHFDGADSALLQLQAALRRGKNGTDNYAYAVKSRVKSIASAVEKVSTKRRKKDPNYRVKDITDVIGIRVLCLFPDQLSMALVNIVDFIKTESENPDGIFKTGSINSSIVEIIIFDSGTSTSESYQHCHRLIVARYGSALGKKITLEKPEPDKPYSSVHIVANMECYLGDKKFSYKIEFQIRNALEDIWAEMDHKLFYKGIDKDKLSSSIAYQMLINQKIHLDAISNTSDHIRTECMLIDRDPLVDQILQSLGVSVAPSRAGIENSSRKVRSRFEIIQKRIGEIAGIIKKKISLPTHELNFDEEDFTAFENLDKMLEEFQESTTNGEKIEKDKFEYFVNMERGLCHLWLAYISKKISIQTGDNNTWKDRSSRYAKTSDCFYCKIVENEVYQNDCFVWFRRSNLEHMVNFNMDKFSEYIKISYGLMINDQEIPDSSEYRIVIPRLYGYALWLEAEEAFRSVESGEIQSQHRQAVLRAFEVTYGLEKFETDTASLRDMPGWASERRKAVNNWVFYAVTFLESGGHQSELDERGLTNADLRGGLACLALQDDGRALEEPSALHTLTVAYRLLNDNMAARYARQLLRILDEQQLDPDDIAWKERMVADAELAIKLFETDPL